MKRPAYIPFPKRRPQLCAFLSLMTLFSLLASLLPVSGGASSVIRALRRNDAVAGELRGLLGSPLDRADVDRARKLVRGDGAIEDSLVLARAYCDEAIDALAPVAGGGPAVDALAAAASGLLDTVPSF